MASAALVRLNPCPTPGIEKMKQHLANEVQEEHPTPAVFAAISTFSLFHRGR